MVGCLHAIDTLSVSCWALGESTTGVEAYRKGDLKQLRVGRRSVDRTCPSPPCLWRSASRTGYAWCVGLPAPSKATTISEQMTHQVLRPAALHREKRTPNCSAKRCPRRHPSLDRLNSAWYVVAEGLGVAPGHVQVRDAQYLKSHARLLEVAMSNGGTNRFHSGKLNANAANHLPAGPRNSSPHIDAFDEMR